MLHFFLILSLIFLIHLIWVVLVIFIADNKKAPLAPFLSRFIEIIKRFLKETINLLRKTF